jgi:toxin FitB
MNLVDTSGWLEYFFGGKNASRFSLPIENTESLTVSVICLYEVFKKVNMVADEAKALQAVAQMKQGVVIPLSEDLALRSSLVSIKYKLAMADSMIYATAQMHNACLWTQDADFEKLANVKYIEKK